MYKYKNQENDNRVRVLQAENNAIRNRIQEKAEAQAAAGPKLNTKEKVKIYMLMLFLPPISIYFALNENSPFHTGEKAVHLFTCCVYMYALLQGFGLLS